MDISELHEEAKLVQGCLHASVAAKCPSTYFLSFCNFLKKLQMRSFSNVKLAYDAAMRRNIPVNIFFTSLTKEQYTVLIIKYCLAGCDISSAFCWDWYEVRFQTHDTSCTEISGTEDLGHGPLSNCQKFTCTQFGGATYEKLDPTSLNEVSSAKAATKVLSTDNSFHLHIPHSKHSPHDYR